MHQTEPAKQAQFDEHCYIWRMGEKWHIDQIKREICFYCSRLVPLGLTESRVFIWPLHAQQWSSEGIPIGGGGHPNCGHKTANEEGIEP